MEEQSNPIADQATTGKSTQESGSISSLETNDSSQQVKRGPGRPRKYPLPTASPSFSGSSNSYSSSVAPKSFPQFNDVSFNQYEMQKMLLKQKVKKYAKKYFSKEQQRWQMQQQMKNQAYDDDEESEQGDDEEEENENYQHQPTPPATPTANTTYYPQPGSKLAQILGYR